MPCKKPTRSDRSASGQDGHPGRRQNVDMEFTKHLREGIRRGRIRCTVRIWKRPHVKVGGRYQMEDGTIVVDSIAAITESDITYDLARESGFERGEDLR